MKSRILQVLVLMIFCNASIAQELISNNGVQNEVRAALSSFDLPQKIDALTTLVAVDTLPVRGIRYIYKLDAEGGNAAENEQGFRAIKANLIQQLCNNPQLIWYKQNFVDMEYLYLDRNESEWFRTRINANDCL